jgi:rod shape determining protein RodA
MEKNDFKLFAKDRGISNSVLESKLLTVPTNMSPFVLEERKLNVAQMDVFSRLMMDRIIFLGKCSHQKTLEILKGSDLLVNPSYTEGIPTTVLEAAILEKPILVAVSGIFVIFLAGINWWLIIAAGILLCAFMPVMWFFLMHDYQRQRVLTFLNPESDPLGTGYHIIQSKIAIGSGGLFGKGWLNGTQSQLDFIPERHTDFIFAVIGEEFGLMGFLVLMLLYLLILYRCLHISLQAQNSFDRLLGGALSLTFFFYVFINIGMVSGILPVVGVPLPLVSYGGTAMITLCAGFGILMSIHTHRRLLA